MWRARSRNPPNIESSDCTNDEASDSICEPTMEETPRIARPTAPVTTRPIPRPGAMSSLIMRPSRNEPSRCGASRKSRALRDGGVSTTTRSHSPSAASCPSFSIAMYSCVPEKDDATV